MTDTDASRETHHRSYGWYGWSNPPIRWGGLIGVHTFKVSVTVKSDLLPTGVFDWVKKGGEVTRVQPQISSDSCTFCRSRKVHHRYPLFSKTTCRSQSIFPFRSNHGRDQYKLPDPHQSWSRLHYTVPPSTLSPISHPHICNKIFTPVSPSHICLLCPGILWYPGLVVDPDPRVTTRPSILKQTFASGTHDVISYPRYV
jgi:hypothetical protein